jgi:2-dehydropantoate 2-reductase
VRVAIHGAGSVGCFIGGAWQAAGIDLLFVGRERIREEIAANGIALSDQNGWSKRLKPEQVDFRTSPEALGEADAIVLTVKSTGTDFAAAEIARYARPGSSVISFQNGISNAATLRRLLPGFAIVHAMVPYNVVHLGAGRWHRATWGELTAERTPVTETLSRQIGERPGKLQLADDMTAIAWGKLLFNLNNAVNALSGTTILEELKQRDFRRVVAAAILETLELLTAAGIEPAKIGQIPPRLLPHAIGSPDFVFRNLFLRVQKIDPKARSSMSDDFDSGRPTEVDWLNGEAVRLASSLGREAPVNAAIVRLVREAEGGGRRAWPAEALRKAVLTK